MIKRINSINFGCFRNYIWNEHICNTNNFSEINLIYGRNGVGKTTFSRLLSSIEQKSLPERFENSEFEVQFERRSKITHNDLENNQIKIKVYNQDYKKKNLKFLIDNETNIESFAVLGERNIEIYETIEISKEKLLKCENKLLEIQEIYETRKIDCITIEKEINDKLRDKAKEIKEGNYRSKSSYNINTIKSEIQDSKKLKTDEKEQLESIFQTDNKEEIKKLDYFKPNFDGIYEKSEQLLNYKINSSDKINELKENKELEKWAEEGMQLNQERRKCGFCGKDISSKRWKKLNSHFNNEFKNFEEMLNSLINDIDSEKDLIEDYLKRSDFDIMPNLENDFEELCSEWEELKENYTHSLNELNIKLNEKKSNLYKEYDLNLDPYDFSCINNFIDRFNKLINENNEFIVNLSNKKEEAKNLLRLDIIASFKILIDYDEKIKKIMEIKNEIELHKKEKQIIEENINDINNEIDNLECDLKDERVAVRLINEYLFKYFIQPEIYLEVEETSDTETNFVIKRNNNIAYDLSEGEQSIISFCYFLASLNEIENDERSEFIIVVDDPISSLDTNNIFIIFSLIESELYEKNYGQLFFTTHDFQLLNRLTQLDKSKKFTIEKIKNGDNIESKLSIMPNYLKNNPTELIYLFKQIHIVANQNISDENFFIFYNFPNNARKFLESYLFTLYPHLPNNERIKNFFGDDISTHFINRVNNTFSHTENHFDRMNNPIDTSEFLNDAKLILKQMKIENENQYNSFVDCIE